MLNIPLVLIIITSEISTIASSMPDGAYATRGGKVGCFAMGAAAAEDRRRQDRRVVRTRNAIREAVLGLSQELDLEKITVAAVARRADIDRKTFYLHYGSVDDVVDELMREEADRVVGFLRDGELFKEGTVDAAELFERLSIIVAQSAPRVERIAPHLSADDVLKRVEAPLTDSLIKADNLGLPDMGPYMSYCVSFFIAGLLAMYRRWLSEDSDLPLENLSAIAGVAALVGLDGILHDERIVRAVENSGSL